MGLLPELPRLLFDAFEGDDELRAWTLDLRPSWHREIIRWITEPVHEETRVRRAAQMAERLLHSMQAEQELPPPLAGPLRSTPHAMAGWRQMSRNCRVTYLLAFFGARSELARQTQIERLVEASVAKGRKKAEPAEAYPD